MKIREFVIALVCLMSSVVYGNDYIDYNNVPELHLASGQMCAELTLAQTTIVDAGRQIYLYGTYNPSVKLNELWANYTFKGGASNAGARGDDVYVFVTETGERYHRGSCQYLRQSKIRLPLSQAKNGYTPCKVCRP